MKVEIVHEAMIHTNTKCFFQGWRENDGLKTQGKGACLILSYESRLEDSVLLVN